MPALVVDAVPVLALAGLLAVAFRAPSGRVEALAALLAVGAVLVVGAVPLDGALEAAREMLPVVVFLVLVLVLAEACAAEGLFSALGSAVARGGRGRPARLLLLAVLAAAATTAVLSLDATVVLLTPVVAAAARATAPAALRPVTLACVRLANSASLLLPVSNLTNLLALPRVDLTFTDWVLVMGPAWVLVVAVEYGGLRLLHRRDLRPARTPAAAPAPPLPRVPLAVLGLVLVGFAVTGPLGVEPFWVAGAGALVLAARAVALRHTSLPALARAGQVPFAAFAVGLAVVVAALGRTVLGDVLEALVPDGHGLVAMLAVAALATVLATVVNNLPATLLLIPLVAPGGPALVLAALVGLDVGSGLTYPASLANLLWRRVLPPDPEAPDGRDFHRVGLLVTPVAVVVAVVAVWASPLL